MLAVTGASGLLGANALTVAVERKLSCLGLYGSNPIAVRGARTGRADLVAEWDQVESLLNEARPTWLFHCAARTQVDECETDPAGTRAINVEATRRLAHWCAQNGARFAYMSSAGVFDGGRGDYSEADTPRPRNVYATSKYEGELATLAECPDALIIRADIYGWNAQPKQSLAEWILARLRSGQEVPGFTDVRFTPILANDLVGMTYDLLEQNASGVFHLGSSDACSKFGFAQAIAHAFGIDTRSIVPVSITNAKFKAPRPPDTSLVCLKAEAALNRKMPSVAEGLARFKELEKR